MKKSQETRDLGGTLVGLGCQRIRRACQFVTQVAIREAVQGVFAEKDHFEEHAVIAGQGIECGDGSSILRFCPSFPAYPLANPKLLRIVDRRLHPQHRPSAVHLDPVAPYPVLDSPARCPLAVKLDVEVVGHDLAEETASQLTPEKRHHVVGGTAVVRRAAGCKPSHGSSHVSARGAPS